MESLVSGRVFALRSVRVFYKKFGNMKYVSHLDMNRFMIRMVRVSGIPVWYSEGFNPHPYITFALPLSLGFDSEYEIMDIRLDDDSFPNQKVYEALKKHMPEGIELIDCDDPVMKAGEVAYADFRIDFTEDVSSMADKLDAFLSAESIITGKRTKKGAIKEINIKEFIKSYKLVGDTLWLTLAAGGSNNLNPKLVLDCFEKKCDIILPFAQITRTMLYNEQMKRFK